MIILDSSILVGLVRGERDVGRLLNLLETEECAIGAPTLVEVYLWCAINLRGKSSQWMQSFIEEGPATVVPFGREMAEAAGEAFRTFGRSSGHAARLNYGDCMAYAVSAVLRALLLFKGGDFGWTDVLAHPASIRI